jgi:hypothetical protein
MGGSMTNNGSQSIPDFRWAGLIDVTFPEHRGGEGTFMQNDNETDNAEQKRAPEVDQITQGHLGRKLRAAYDEIVRQPVPDKFLKLLEELERREKSE